MESLLKPDLLDIIMVYTSLGALETYHSSEGLTRVCSNCCLSDVIADKDEEAGSEKREIESKRTRG